MTVAITGYLAHLIVPLVAGPDVAEEGQGGDLLACHWGQVGSMWDRTGHKWHLEHEVRAIASHREGKGPRERLKDRLIKQARVRRLGSGIPAVSHM